MENEVSLGSLAEQWKAQAELELKSRQERERIEDLMSPRLNNEVTLTPAGHKITITRRTNRSLDHKQLLRIVDDIPQHIHRVRLGCLADEEFLNFLRDNEPDVVERLEGAIKVTPARPLISIGGRASV
jgi:hypothetical protein|tara:strand:+ start:311 stop:694 length:384 start_codon:yes stop_codon:yes gene_type:complete